MLWAGGSTASCRHVTNVTGAGEADFMMLDLLDPTILNGLWPPHRNSLPRWRERQQDRLGSRLVLLHLSHLAKLDRENGRPSRNQLVEDLLAKKGLTSTVAVSKHRDVDTCTYLST